MTARKSWLCGLREALMRRLVASVKWRLGIEEFSAKFAAIEQQLGAITPSVSTWAVTSWVEQATLAKTPLVSVILPTHNRSRLLRRAVTSLVAQTYPNWEVVIVDDGSTDETPDLVTQLMDELGRDKFQSLRIDASGVCAARNHGLAAARGEFIAYLDDDNTMHPLWLKSVVWAFSQRPDVDVVYGGIIVDDFRRLSRLSEGDMPSFHLNPFDLAALREYNLADIGAIAHRNRLADARFDESLHGLGDWDLLARLTRQKAPLVLPVIACYYTTSAPNRLSEHPCVASEIGVVQERLKR